MENRALNLEALQDHDGMKQHVNNSGGSMNVVLWVSRHPPLQSQIKTLMEKLGEASVEIFSENIANAEVVVEKARKVGAKYIVPVLPLSMIARLSEASRKEGFTILFARMEAIATTKSVEEAKRIVLEKPESRSLATYSDGSIRIFEFKGFEKLREVRMITEPF